MNRCALGDNAVRPTQGILMKNKRGCMMQKMKTKKNRYTSTRVGFRLSAMSRGLKLALGVAVVANIFPVQALGQDGAVLEEVLVTGSNIRRDTFPQLLR